MHGPHPLPGSARSHANRPLPGLQRPVRPPYGCSADPANGALPHRTRSRAAQGPSRAPRRPRHREESLARNAARSLSPPPSLRSNRCSPSTVPIRWQPAAMVRARPSSGEPVLAHRFAASVPRPASAARADRATPSRSRGRRPNRRRCLPPGTQGRCLVYRPPEVPRKPPPTLHRRVRGVHQDHGYPAPPCPPVDRLRPFGAREVAAVPVERAVGVLLLFRLPRHCLHHTVEDRAHGRSEEPGFRFKPRLLTSPPRARLPDSGGLHGEPRALDGERPVGLAWLSTRQRHPPPCPPEWPSPLRAPFARLAPGTISRKSWLPWPVHHPGTHQKESHRATPCRLHNPVQPPAPRVPARCHVTRLQHHAIALPCRTHTP